MSGFEAGFENEENLKRDIAEEVQLHRTLLARSERKIPRHLNQGKGIESECRSILTAHKNKNKQKTALKS